MLYLLFSTKAKITPEDKCRHDFFIIILKKGYTRKLTDKGKPSFKL